VRGRVWLEGRAAPLELELAGDAHPDLAGCLLTFVNPRPQRNPRDLEELHPQQHGTIGDLTASRKVRVPAVPMEEFLNWPKDQGRAPSRWANCLYLEWFSEANGRVVIESADFELTLSAPEWRLTPEEEAERARQADAGMQGFLGQLTAAIEAQESRQKPPDVKWNEHDYERFMKTCDASTEKYGELLDKYGDTEDAEAKIAAAMGWDNPADLDADDDPEPMSVEELNAVCAAAANAPDPEPDPHREGIDWIRTGDGAVTHPLQHRCFESALKLWRAAGQLAPERRHDPDLDQCVFEFQTTAAKLAGALGSIAQGVALPDPPFTVAYLKRALDHLHKSQAGLEAVAPKRLLPEPVVAEARTELLAIREGILRLMDRFRGRHPGA
jgi:hypothetical protein